MTFSSIAAAKDPKTRVRRTRHSRLLSAEYVPNTAQKAIDHILN